MTSEIDTAGISPSQRISHHRAIGDKIGAVFVKSRLQPDGSWHTLNVLKKANPSKDGDAKPPV